MFVSYRSYLKWSPVIDGLERVIYPEAVNCFTRRRLVAVPAVRGVVGLCLAARRTLPCDTCPIISSLIGYDSLPLFSCRPPSAVSSYPQFPAFPSQISVVTSKISVLLISSCFLFFLLCDSPSVLPRALHACWVWKTCDFLTTQPVDSWMTFFAGLSREEKVRGFKLM